MRTSCLLLAAGPLLALVPASLAACDLDGLPGFYRANPFAGAPMFRGIPLPRPAQEPERASGNTTEKKPASETGTPAPTPEPQPVRAWESRENYAPVSEADKATFS